MSRRRRRLTGLALGALVLAGAASAAANDLGVAVIVGNKAYSDDRVPEVSYAHNDAEAFKRFVTGRLGFDADNVIDLRDATKSQLETAFGVKGNAQGLLWRYIDPSGGSDVVVFYSGHGVPGKAGRGYLLPVDSNPDTAELNGYPIDLLYENLGSLSTQSTTVFLDACFSGGSPRGMLIQSASPVYVEADISGGAGLTVLTAASGAQLASWDERARHGLFTEHLLDGLYGAADADGNGQVTAREAKLHLDRTMTRAARREFGRVQDAGLHGDESAVLSFSSTGDWGSRPSLGPPPAAFTVLTEPADAQIRVLNIGPRYRAGMDLAAGSYEVEVSAPGYVTKTETVAHGSSPTMHRMTLSRPGQPFTMEPKPAEAQVRLVDHAEPYQHGMLLPPGSYRVEASAEGYETATESVVHGTSPTVQEIVLRKTGPKTGDRFRDCPECPEMVVLPAGSYRMGSPSYEQGRSEDEGPVHEVTIAAPFALGAYEVTVAEFGRFVDETGYSAGNSCFTDEGGSVEDRAGRGWRNPGFGQSGRSPVACVNWNDAQAYAAWLSRVTGEKYRLPSESEWEYAARAGTATARYWGEGESGQCRHANGGDVSAKERYSDWPLPVASCRDGHVHTAPAGSFAASSWGLHDMLGNVWEWTEDCWNGSYGGAPSDGNAWEYGECNRRVFARRFVERLTIDPPRRGPGRELIRQPRQLRRVPCGPDARPMNPNLSTSGVWGALAPPMGSKGEVLGRNFSRFEGLSKLSEGQDSSPSPDRARSTGAALEAHYRFVVWLVPTLERFPRSQKFLLGDRIQHTALDVLERLIEAPTSWKSGGNASPAIWRPQASRLHPRKTAILPRTAPSRRTT